MVKKFYSSFCLFSVLFITLAPSSTGFAQVIPSGTLDSTFSTDGKVMTPVTSFANEARAIAIQSDGKVIVAGNASNNTLNSFGLVRYNTDGTLDNAFGTAGKTTTSCGPGNNVARAIIIQPDGKIVVAGNQENQTYSQFAVARYNTNGTLDNTFGSGGKVLTHLDYGFDLAYAVAIQTDGKIVAAGVSYDTLFNAEFGVVRYNTNGTLDNTFGGTGKVRTSLGTTWDQAQAVVIQTDGKIVVGGRTSTQMAMTRYNTNGTLDGTFGLGGIVTLPLGTYSDIINALQLKPDGRILAGGVTQDNTDYNFALVQFDTYGAVDGTFGISGFVFGDFGGADIINALATDANGNLLAAGVSGPSTNPEFIVARYDSLGNSDFSFYNQGFVNTSFGGGVGSVASGIAIQADGKIVATGSAMNGTYRNFATARYFPTEIFVGMNEIDHQSNLTLFPNPATDHVMLSSKTMMDKIEVVDVLGNIVYENNSKLSGAKIDTHSFANGVYLVKVKSGIETSARKLIVKH